MTKEITLTNGKIALVDDDMYERLSRYSWTYNQRYAWRYCSELKHLVLMHHDVLPRRPGYQTDHINGDGLDNRRENLRYATPGQNAGNRRKNRNGSSQYKGVFWSKEAKAWLAKIQVNYQPIPLGKFDCEEAAARAYDAAARQYHGRFARLNFPNEVN